MSALLVGLAARLRADAEGVAKWQQMFPMGVFHRADFPGGSIEIDAAYCATMVENWKKRGSPELPIDYFHRGASDVEVPNSEKVAAGVISELQARPDGMWGLTTWTATARAKILANELLFISPEWRPDGIDVSTGKRQGPTFLGAALLNDPFFKEMPRVAARDVAVPPANPTTGLRASEKHMDKKLICEALGLAPDSTDEAVMAALKKMATAAAAAVPPPPPGNDGDADDKVKTAMAPVIEKLTATQGALKSVSDEHAKLSAAFSSLVKEKETIAATAKANGIEQLAKDLVREGKVIPASRESVKLMANAIGLEEAGKYFRSLPSVVDARELGHGGADDRDEDEKVKASAAEKQKAGMSGSAAIRAAALENPEAVRKLAVVHAAKPTA